MEVVKKMANEMKKKTTCNSKSFNSLHVHRVELSIS